MHAARARSVDAAHRRLIEVYLLHEVRELHDGLVVERLDLGVHGQPHLLEQLGRESGRDARELLGEELGEQLLL